MASIRYDEINFSEILTFLSVAKTLSMSISAKELHISQPAISKRIGRLEKNYGIILFVRTNMGLQLTPAGRVFYQELEAAYSHIVSAFTKASEMQSSPIRTLKLGHDSFFDIPLLYEIISRYTQKNAYSKVQIYQHFEEQCTDLMDGTADLMICPNSYFASIQPYVRHEPIAAFQFAILVAKENPLANKENLEIAELRGVPLTVAHMNADSPYLKTLQEMFLKHGFSPRLEHLVERDSLCLEILLKQGVGIASPSFWKRLPERTARFFEERIRVYPIEEEIYPVSFVWKAENEDEEIRRFIETYREVIQEGENREILFQSYH